MQIHHLGVMCYAEALQYMDKLHTEVSRTENHAGHLIVVEHPPTVTMGYRNNEHDLLVTPEMLQANHVDYFKIDRGGSVTVHEPGQCVIYPIFNLFDFGHTVRSYVCALENAMIQTCAHFGVVAMRDSENPGIWIGNDKIGAVGIRVHDKVTKHGIAFNILNSLQTFRYIIPCGLKTKGVTNLYLARLAQNISSSNESFNFEIVSNYLVETLQNTLYKSKDS